MKTMFLLLSVFVTPQLIAQELAKFNIKIDEEELDAPVCVSLDGINYNTDKGNLVLYEVTSTGEKAVPSQLEQGYTAHLWFLLNGVSEKEFGTEIYHEA